MPSITVGMKWDKGAIYIGRGSPLGNPFPMHCEADRDLVCDSFNSYFKDKVEKQDPYIVSELNRILELAETQEVILGCYCKSKSNPKRCHGDTVKEYLEERLLAKEHRNEY